MINEPPRTSRAHVEGRIGRVVAGKYTITRLIGIGGMAAVYEAVQADGRRVALKMLEPVHGAALERRMRLLREAYLANNLRHTDVVHVFADGVDDDGSAFLVMELLQGESVADMQRAAGGKLAPARALWIADRVLDVLAVAHANGVVHRDIKPDNLFVTSQGRVKVLDFGCAQLREHVEGLTLHTIPGTMLGTVAYMPPEQARGASSEIDHRTDLWALGATLFSLLSGSFVHAGETPNERLGMAAMQPARSLRDAYPGASAKLVAAVDRALRFDRLERWPDARSMQRALREASNTLAPGEIWDGAPREPTLDTQSVRNPMERARAALAEISDYRVPGRARAKAAALTALFVAALVALVALVVHSVDVAMLKSSAATQTARSSQAGQASAPPAGVREAPRAPAEAPANIPSGRELPATDSSTAGAPSLVPGSLPVAGAAQIKALAATRPAAPAGSNAVPRAAPGGRPASGTARSAAPAPSAPRSTPPAAPERRVRRGSDGILEPW